MQSSRQSIPGLSMLPTHCAADGTGCDPGTLRAACAELDRLQEVRGTS